MADETAWRDRDMIINIAEGFKKCFDDFTTLFQEVEKFKFEVLDNPARTTELKKILAEDPNWTVADIQTKCDEIRTIYDFLMALRKKKT